MIETTQSHAGLTIRAARVVPARPEDAYRAFTDPALCRAWWGKTEKTEMAECAIDARVGGTFRFAIRMPDGTSDAASGSFAEVFPAQKLVFGWSVADGGATPRDTRVTMEFHDLKDGTTRIVVTHEGLPSPHAAHLHSAGWHNMLQDMSLHFVAS
jgi:uncharacterized protein YndB with AHSA1/START domain